MPAEFLNIEDFVRLSQKALYCNVNRLDDIVKLKLRTTKKLYTLKTNPNKVNEILKKLNCEIREI